MVLRAKQINHGQSEIWLELEGEELTPHRALATNEVVNVTRRLCPDDVFKDFYQRYHVAVGQAASLSVPNLEEIATELKLNTK